MNAAGFVLSQTASLASTAITPGPTANTIGPRASLPVNADQQQPDHVGRYLAAIQAEPRTAAELAELVNAPLNQVLWELRMLEGFGKLRPRTDARGVQYWMPMHQDRKML